MLKSKKDYRIKYTTKSGGKVELVWEGNRSDAMARARKLIDSNLVREIVLIEGKETVILKVGREDGKK